VWTFGTGAIPILIVSVACKWEMRELYMLRDEFSESCRDVFHVVVRDILYGFIDDFVDLLNFLVDD
jgi:hypothetical protein